MQGARFFSLSLRYVEQLSRFIDNIHLIVTGNFFILFGGLADQLGIAVELIGIEDIFYPQIESIISRCCISGRCQRRLLLLFFLLGFDVVTGQIFANQFAGLDKICLAQVLFELCLSFIGQLFILANKIFPLFFRHLLAQVANLGRIIRHVLCNQSTGGNRQQQR